ncbi:MAG: hypothetical protein ABFD52_04575 [Acidobacteriota bacterium]
MKLPSQPGGLLRTGNDYRSLISAAFRPPQNGALQEGTWSSQSGKPAVLRKPSRFFLFKDNGKKEGKEDGGGDPAKDGLEE